MQQELDYNSNLKFPQILEQFVNKQVSQISLFDHQQVKQLYQDLKSHQVSQQEESKNNQSQKIDPIVQLDFGVILNFIGKFRKVIENILDTLNPSLKDHFREIGQYGIDKNDFLAFFLDYDASSDNTNHIEFHKDESYITINICLKKPEIGGNLIFQDQNGVETQICIEEGKAICHYSDLLHSTQPFTVGNRASLIIYTLVNHNHLNKNFYEATYLPYIKMKALNTSNIHFDVATIPDCCSRLRRIPKNHGQLSQILWAKILGYLSPFDHARKCSFVCYTWYRIIKSLPYQTLKNPNQKLSKEKFQEWKQITQSFRNMQGQNSIQFIHTGGAGIRTGHQMWRMLSYNHLKSGQNYSQKIFTEQKINKENVLVPKAIFIDSSFDDADYRNIQYNNLQDINKYFDYDKQSTNQQSYKYLYNSNLMLNQPVHADYYQGTWLEDNEKFQQICDQIRLNIEQQDKLDAFIFTHSLSGQSTTAINKNLYQHLKLEYSRKIYNFSIFPNYPSCNNFVTALQDKYPQTPYYSLLNCNDLLTYSDGIFAFNNTAIHKYLQTDFDYPMINDFNKIIGSEMYNLIDMVTNENSYCNLEDLFKNQIPFSSLKLLGCHSYPYQFKNKQQHCSVAENTNAVFETSNNFTGMNNNRGKYFAVTLNFKGDVVPKDVMAAICTIKTKRNINFVDWAPTGFKCSIQYLSSKYLQDYQILSPKSSVQMLYNTTEFRTYYDHIMQQSLRLTNRNAYLQHFSEDNIYESQENLKTVIQDYIEASEDQEDEEGEQE